MKSWDNYECDGQISLFDLNEEPKKTKRIPCFRECDVEWCSLTCFLRRGYIRHEGKWVRNDKGEILIANNKECDWTPKTNNIDEAKAPIWHSSLTACYVECPTCHEINHIENYHDRCPDCGQLLDQSPEAIAKAEKVSADLKECRKLGLHGAVRKNEKGKWEEVNNGTQNRR
jgi:hypothetical protein